MNHLRRPSPVHRAPVYAPAMAGEVQRVALVTGAAKRVGRAVAERLAAGGFDIAFTYNTSKREADELAKALTNGGRQSCAIKADLTKPEKAAVRVFEQVTEAFGRLDVLVNNASLYEP